LLLVIVWPNQRGQPSSSWLECADRLSLPPSHGISIRSMSRTNLDPLITFPDGSHLVMSTQCSRQGEFSCALYTAIIAPDDSASFQMVSSHLEASTCLSAQEHAYGHAMQLYPRAAERMKKPPYLIWHGPPPKAG
jgi:hypothetical protein